MSRKRTNFKIMEQKDFIAYLEDKDVPHSKIHTTTVLGLSVTKVIPDHFRLGHRVFETKTGNQIDPSTELTGNEIKPKGTKSLSKKQLIRIIDQRVQNMGTKGVYHPKRLKPKWNSLTDDNKKLEIFEKYVTSKDSSIGFLKLIKVNLCHKTLEAVIIEHPTCVDYLKSKNVKSLCIDKFSRYDHGKQYLIKKVIEPSG